LRRQWDGAQALSQPKNDWVRFIARSIKASYILCGTSWREGAEHDDPRALEVRYRLMVWGVMTIPILGVLWLHSSTPLNHTFRVTTIAGAEIAVMLMYLWSFKCPNCRVMLSAVSREILFDSAMSKCPHCGINLDRAS
jgi:predicted RNA-binding Zn-ribbon protein involved in translation (DUF1610 family)